MKHADRQRDTVTKEAKIQEWSEKKQKENDTEEKNLLHALKDFYILGNLGFFL